MVINCKSQVLLHAVRRAWRFSIVVQADTPLPAAIMLVSRETVIIANRSDVTRKSNLDRLSYAEAFRVIQILVALNQSTFGHAQKKCTEFKRRPFFHPFENPNDSKSDI